MLDDDSRLMVGEVDAWHKVCTNGMSAHTADVICRQIGLTRFVGFGEPGDFPDYNFWESTDIKYYTNSRCSGKRSINHLICIYLFYSDHRAINNMSST